MESARIVIIGGGIVGCSIAYHLAQRGPADVVLLDKGELTSGSTWHAAGMVTHFHTSSALMRMRQYSIGLYRQLQNVPGAVQHWREVGSIRVASSRDQYRFRWSTDITPAENPLEAGLGSCVRMAKGDFIGRQALLQGAKNGLSRRLCTLTVRASGDVVLYGGEAVYAADRVVGRLRLESLLPFWELTSEQDWQLCEQNQAGVRSRAFTPGPYSTKRESNVIRWTEWYLAEIARPL